MSESGTAAVDSGLPAGVPGPAVLGALLRVGRWSDAADYAVRVEETAPLWCVALALAARRPAAARELLHTLSPEDRQDAAFESFLEYACRVVAGEETGFGPLVDLSASVPQHPVIARIMLLAAHAAGHLAAAAHYGRIVASVFPADPAAIEAIAGELAVNGDYVSLVRLVDRGETVSPADGARPLDVACASSGPDRVRALVTVGHFMHRETDPTVPVDEATSAARTRWRAAYRRHVKGRAARACLRLAVIAAGAGLSVWIGNGLPVVLVALGLVAWKRTRPLPGLDHRATRIVRALDDPLMLLKKRRYRAVDVVTFVLAAIAFGVLAAELPHGSSSVAVLEIIGVVVLSGAVTRGRRRWVRRDRTGLRLPGPDDNTCRCLDVDVLRGPAARTYRDVHLFAVGAAPAAPQWPILQCMNTFTRFLDIPAGEQTIRLS